VPVNVLNKITSGIAISILAFLRRYPFRRVLVSILLVSVLIPLLASAQSTSSQTSETRTTTLTGTSFGVTAATTSYQTSTVTLQAVTQLSRMVFVGPATGRVPCNYARATYTVKDPGYVFGHFNASSAIAFYFLTDLSSLNWIPWGIGGGSGMSCTPPKQSYPLVSVEDGLSYSFEVYVSTPGLYDFVFLNFSHIQPVTVNFSANTGQAGTTTTTYAMLSYSTITQPFVLTSTQTLGSISSQAAQSSFFLLGQKGLLIYATLGSIAIIASVLVVAWRRKPSSATVMTQEHLATVQEPPRAIAPSQPETGTRAVQSQRIISTGYVDLDKALEGGIPEKFSVVIVSPSFDERDLLLRRVVQSALSSGKLAILLSNDIGRTEDMISRYENRFYALSPQADKISPHGPNLLKIPNIENLSETNISLGITLKEVMAKEKASRPIMILDLLSDLLLRYKSITTRRWLTDFVGKRKAEGFTIIATLNPLTTTKEETQSIIDFFDGVIEIFEKPIAERTRRFLMIRKMYGQRYSENEMIMDKDKLF
jgi:archaellum biogenesis ATPase FlaH